MLEAKSVYPGWAPSRRIGEANFDNRRRLALLDSGGGARRRGVRRAGEAGQGARGLGPGYVGQGAARLGTHAKAAAARRPAAWRPGPDWPRAGRQLGRCDLGSGLRARPYPVDSFFFEFYF
jgi:hypothetical protein